MNFGCTTYHPEASRRYQVNNVAPTNQRRVNLWEHLMEPVDFWPIDEWPADIAQLCLVARKFRADMQTLYLFWRGNGCTNNDGIIDLLQATTVVLDAMREENHDEIRECIQLWDEMYRDGDFHEVVYWDMNDGNFANLPGPGRASDSDEEEDPDIGSILSPARETY